MGPGIFSNLSLVIQTLPDTLGYTCPTCSPGPQVPRTMKKKKTSDPPAFVFQITNRLIYHHATLKSIIRRKQAESEERYKQTNLQDPLLPQPRALYKPWAGHISLFPKDASVKSATVLRKANELGSETLPMVVVIKFYKLFVLQEKVVATIILFSIIN